MIGYKAVFGTEFCVSDIFIPFPVKKWKAKFRNDEFATIFLLRDDGKIEHRFLLQGENGKLIPADWCIAENRRNP